ncbi:sulfur carrier protein ThiS [Lentibacillus lipolyticus]|nr:sulfur carrier protein ThiS [Lentibacillus lipolyticus]
MQLLINGNMTEIPDSIKTIADVKQHFQISNPVVIVEHNGEILEKDSHAVQEIANGDKIEFVQFVGGG